MSLSEQINSYEEPLRDYLATMVQDAEYNWKDEHDEDFPDVECIEESAVKDASAFVEAFQKQFPSSKAEGGELYLSRLYGESNLPKDEAEWIGEHWWTDKVPEAGESVDGQMMIFCE